MTTNIFDMLNNNNADVMNSSPCSVSYGTGASALARVTNFELAACCGYLEEFEYGVYSAVIFWLDPWKITTDWTA